MKGIDVSVSMILAIVVGVAVVLILAAMITGNVTSLQEFSLSNIEFNLNLTDGGS